MAIDESNTVTRDKVRKRKELRDIILRGCYQAGWGRPETCRASFDQLADLAGVPEEWADRHSGLKDQAKILVADGLLKFVPEYGMDGDQESIEFFAKYVELTRPGFDAAERLIDPPAEGLAGMDSPNVVVFGNVTGSSIVANSRDVSIKHSQIEEATALLESMREVAVEAALQADERAELEAQLATAEAQLQARRPIPTIVSAALNIAKGILETAGAATAVAALKLKFPGLFQD